MEKEGAVAEKAGESSALASARRGPQPPAVKSVTRDEIERFWRRKRMEEEEHLLAAQKAAARIRARTLTEDDYRRFEESLREVIEKSKNRRRRIQEEGEDGGANEERRVGIKDWWTKSKYAYLNQPAIKSMGENAAQIGATTTYIPRKACFCSSILPCSAAVPSLGVF